MDKSQTISTLQRAKAEIEDIENWTKGLPNRYDGKRVMSCAVAAVWDVQLSDGELRITRDSPAVIALTEAARQMFPDRIEKKNHKMLVAQVNDHPDTTHEDIMAMYDRAIELA